MSRRGDGAVDLPERAGDPKAPRRSWGDRYSLSPAALPRAARQICTHVKMILLPT